MRLVFILLICLPICVSAQKFQLTIVNGYGDGLYTAGDTLHIWAREEKLTETFKTWSGDTVYLEDPGEWHTRLLMPAKNISVTANFVNLPAFAKLTFERMKGRDTLKPVQYYFPTKGQKVKALVWMFHGSGQSINLFPGQVDGVSIIKALMANDYAVAISECDETTFHKDFNGDGSTRWEFTINNNLNRDMQNLQLFRDTFIARGYMTDSLPQMGVGFSAGGAFALLNGWLMKFTRGVTYCAPGPNLSTTNSTMPTQWFMSINDNHPDVGEKGNDTAFMNYNVYRSRGICAGFNLFLTSPCHPDFFRRIPGVDSVRSLILYNELKAMNAIDGRNYFRFSADQIKLNVAANPIKYPGLISLSPAQAEELELQISILLAFHTPHSHFNAKLIRFLDSGCGNLTTPINEVKDHGSFKFFPNPAQREIHIQLPKIPDQSVQVSLFDLTGKCTYRKEFGVSTAELINVKLPVMVSGVYALQIKGDQEYHQVQKVQILY